MLRRLPVIKRLQVTKAVKTLYFLGLPPHAGISEIFCRIPLSGDNKCNHRLVPMSKGIDLIATSKVNEKDVLKAQSQSDKDVRNGSMYFGESYRLESTRWW